MFIPYLNPLPSHTTMTISRLTYPPNSSVVSFGSISITMVTGSPMNITSYSVIWNLYIYVYEGDEGDTADNNIDV